MYQGYTNYSQLNLGTNTPGISSHLNYNTITGYAIADIPVIQPYGICSLAPAGAWCIYNSLGNGYNGTYISGYTNPQPADSNLSGLVAGESATYNSSNFTRQLKLDGVLDVFTGAIAKITTAAINGTNTNQVLIDLCAEITALESYINSFVMAYNIHIHGGVQSGSSDTTVPTVTGLSYSPTSNFNRDETFLNQSPIQNFINTNGKALV